MGRCGEPTCRHIERHRAISIITIDDIARWATYPCDYTIIQILPKGSAHLAIKVIIDTDVIRDVVVLKGLLPHLIRPQGKPENVRKVGELQGTRGHRAINNNTEHISVLQLRTNRLTLNGILGERREWRIPIVLEGWLSLPIQAIGLWAIHVSAINIDHIHVDGPRQARHGMPGSGHWCHHIEQGVLPKPGRGKGELQLGLIANAR